MYDPEKVYPVTPCMNVYKTKIKSDGSLDKLKLRFVIRGYLYNKETFGDTWHTTESMRTLQYFLAYAFNNKARVQQLDLIREFLQANIKHRVFVNFDSRYGEYFLEYCYYFGRP